MITNADVTIFNSYYDKKEGLNKYKRTYLKGVNFQSSVGVKNDRVRGLVDDNIISIYVPFTVDSQGKKYIKPKAYARLSEDDKDECFTFNHGDKVVKGIINFELNGSTGGTIADLENYYDDVYDISTIVTNDCGSSDLSHWRVGVK